MPNVNYNAGRRFEYKVKKDWEQRGYTVLRTAGSHGAFDLIAVHESSGTVHFIQCKRVESKAQARKLLDRFREDPPWSDKFNQYMAVYVAATRETLTGAV